MKSIVAVLVSREELCEIVRAAVHEALQNAPPRKVERQYIEASEVATYFGVSRATVTNWLDEGCPHMRRGQILRFELAAVDDWFRGRAARSK